MENSWVFDSIQWVVSWVVTISKELSWVDFKFISFEKSWVEYLKFQEKRVELDMSWIVCLEIEELSWSMLPHGGMNWVE